MASSNVRPFPSKVRNLSIRTKLLLGMTLFFSAAAGVLFWHLPSIHYQHAYARQYDGSVQSALLLASMMAPYMAQGDAARVNTLLTGMQTDSGVLYIHAFDQSGGEIAIYERTSGQRPAPPARVRQELWSVNNGDVLHLEVPVRHGAHEIGGLMLGYSLAGLQRELDGTRHSTIMVCGGLLVIGILFTVGLARTVTLPILRLTQTVQQISADNLHMRISIRSNDEVGRLSAAFNGMAERLQGAQAAKLTSMQNEQRTREAVMETSGKLLETSNHILSATTQQASGAQQQVAAVTEAVATVKEVNRTAEEAANRASMVSESSRNALEVGQAGREAIEETITSMGAIKQQVESIAEEILSLAERAQAIGDIVATVNEIAEQTNLLALNAAIEASRAGEHGRGFSVVASEVKELASQSKKATAQIRQILTEIQRATNGAVMATETGTKKVGEAVQIVHGAGDTIRTLVATVEEAAEVAAQIAASAGQQASGMTHINIAMKNINQVASENLSSTKKAEQAARDLNQLAGTLRELLIS